MALAYLFDPNKQFQDRNGVNNVSGFLRVYYEGTDDRATTYKNFIGTLNPADIPIDNDGRAVVIVEDEKTYRLEVYSRNGNLQWTQHPVFPQGCGGSEYDGDVSNATATFTKDDGDTSELLSGSTLKVLFTKISMFFAGLKRVAFTGSYNDLSDKPSIPAAQVQSDWSQSNSSAVDYIKNKPDLAQYIPKSQKGAANGVGTLGANSLQPFEETYNGYFVENNGGSAKVVKIGRFKGSNELRDAGGASFSIVFRSTNQASGQALLWVQKGEFNKTDSVCRKVVIFNRPNSGGTGDTGTSIQFYKDDVTVAGVNYVDVYMSMRGYSTARITPLWMNRDMAQLTFSSESVELPQTAVIIDDSWFVRAPGEGAGDVSTPVFIAPNGVATPCTMALVARTGSYNDLSDKPSIPDVSGKLNINGDNATAAGSRAIVDKLSYNDDPTIDDSSKILQKNGVGWEQVDLSAYLEYLAGKHFPIMESVSTNVSKTVASGEENAIILGNVNFPTRKTRSAIAIVTVTFKVDSNYGQIDLSQLSRDAEFSLEDTGSAYPVPMALVKAFDDLKSCVTFQMPLSLSFYPSSLEANVYKLNAPIGVSLSASVRITTLGTGQLYVSN